MLEDYFSSSHQLLATELPTFVTIWYLTSFFILILLGKNVLYQPLTHHVVLLLLLFLIVFVFHFCPFIAYVLKTLILRPRGPTKKWRHDFNIYVLKSIFVLLLIHQERQCPLPSPEPCTNTCLDLPRATTNALFSCCQKIK